MQFTFRPLVTWPRPAIVTPPPMTVDEAARFVALHAGVEAVGILNRADDWRNAYRIAARKFHPDTNGGVQRPEWNTLQRAAELLNRRHGL